MNTTTTVAVPMKSEDIVSRVNSSNSFTKGEMLANRDSIRVARAEKRSKLAEFTGSNVGTLVDKVRTDHQAVVTDIKSRRTATQQTWTITMKAKVHATPADALKAKIARAQKSLNKLEGEYEKATEAKTVVKV